MSGEMYSESKNVKRLKAIIVKCYEFAFDKGMLAELDDYVSDVPKKVTIKEGTRIFDRHLGFGTIVKGKKKGKFKVRWDHGSEFSSEMTADNFYWSAPEVTVGVK